MNLLSTTMAIVFLNVNSYSVPKYIKRFQGTRLFSTNSKKIVFLGTPVVAANCLKKLFDSSQKDGSGFTVSAVVTQPPAPAGRNKKLTPSPVHLLAEKLNIELMIPEKANEAEFLRKLADISPDLCITAAYGNYLPRAFLSIPQFGTINIHPSMLPKYRGASPVQRALERGDNEIGITILKTVQKMDAGPVFLQIPYPLDGDETSTSVLENSFDIGIKELVRLLPTVWAGTAPLQVQDEALATEAPKISTSEARVDFSELSAEQVHNRCRAFSDWPGVWSMFSIGSQEPQKIKIIRTKVIDPSPDAVPAADRTKDVVMAKVGGEDVFRVVCGDGSVLGVLELQPLSRKAMRARDFLNGLQKQAFAWQTCPSADDSQQ